MAKKSRRSKEKSRPQRPQDWSPEEKLLVVVESRGLTDQELGAFLRKEGLHQAQLDEWSAPPGAALEPAACKGTKKASAESKRIRELERELRRKEKALAEAAALLILKKKAQAIWGAEHAYRTQPRRERQARPPPKWGRKRRGRAGFGCSAVFTPLFSSSLGEATPLGNSKAPKSEVPDPGPFRGEDGEKGDIGRSPLCPFNPEPQFTKGEKMKTKRK